ncbi:MAG: type IVB secretion system protein IcmH/DotU [Pseudomonas sp.]|uniref:type IVB secretion system protein IcmH/DotU n=1 Tax=Pseudomonas sp. TaxID=306 RepID=UPI003D1064A2
MSTSIKMSNARPEPSDPAACGSVRNSVFRTESSESIQDKSKLDPGLWGDADQDADLQFQMRGHSLNPLLDAAQSLFALVIRVRRIESADADKLYPIVRDQITTICEEARQAGYDPATQLAYRYSLCVFIDEAVMATAWGNASTWRDRSLLSYHHNETWGGEKFFSVLARMQMDPARYKDILEFKYMCLCLGFQGKYGQQHDCQAVINDLIVKLHRILRAQRGETPERLFDEPDNVVSRRHRLPRQWPLWTPWVLAAVALAGSYFYFSISLEHSTEQVLRSLDFILRP